MTQPTAAHLRCPVVVLTLTAGQIQGDDLADQLRSELLAVAVQTQAPPVNVVLDFAAVTFLTSTGFRPLLSLNRLLRQQHGKLLLCNLAPEVLEVFEVTRLVNTRGGGRAPFEVYPDVPSAVASLYRPPTQD